MKQLTGGKKFIGLGVKRDEKGGESRIIEFDVPEGSTRSEVIHQIETTHNHELYIWEPIELGHYLVMIQRAFDAGRRLQSRDKPQWHNLNPEDYED